MNPTFTIRYQRSDSEPLRTETLAYSGTPGPKGPFNVSRYCVRELLDNDWLQGALTPGQIYQQLYSKLKVEEGGYFILEDEEGKALWASPRWKAQELGCNGKGICDLRVLPVETYRERQKREKAARAPKRNASEGWFK